ncbi:hypothetical protein FA95DRAFT_1518689 [Auriscalpium vulgare]|uniref:Uncharacterized protein n=1 Tax=Auriscalpium vulgare TaxID=40419 RepID=A0ACB8RVV4_9AGAM|nr:hypothetical protein FA95DRAFT_1518689 [Auriscalpium vulgare]
MAADDSKAPEWPTSAKKQTLSPWIPISLLAVTTAALAVPLVLLRRNRAATISDLGHKLDTAPPRRAATRRPNAASHVTSGPPRRRVTRSADVAHRPREHVAGAHVSSTVHSQLSETRAGSSAVPSQQDDFNGALYTLKAFSIATAAVTFGGATLILGVKAYLGVKDTQEFASVMRQILLSKMPGLSARIHRPTTSEPAPPFPITSSHAPSPPPSHSPDAQATRAAGESATWTWSEAQQRLSEAFEGGGLSRWAEVAAGELEAEAQVERAKRGL